MTGVRELKIDRWIAETQFLDRAGRPGSRTATSACCRRARGPPCTAFASSSVFKALTILAAEAKLSAAEVKKLVTQVNGAASEEDARQIVETERETRADEIRAVASGFSPDRKSKGSAQHIGGLLRFDVDALLDVAPEKQYETFTRSRSCAIASTSSSTQRPAEVGPDRRPPSRRTMAAWPRRR